MISLYRQIQDFGVASPLIANQSDTGDERLDDVDLLERGHDQELQVQVLEKLETVFGRIIRAPTKRLIDQDKAKRPGTDSPPLQAKLISKAGG